MKKFIVLSALVAATSAAFVACSSDDDLAQQPKAPETTIEEGTPLKISFVDATRGTDWTDKDGLNPLDKFTLFATSNDGTTRWSGALGDRGSSTSVSNGTVFNNDGSGNFAAASDISWQAGTWDFYAVSDALHFATEDDGHGGDQDAEHLDAASRNFTYEVPTTYNAQEDLLVGAAIGKKQSDGKVTINSYHALARIEKFMVYFKQLKSNTEDDKIASNSTKCFLIKSITLKNVKKTGKFTFPSTWAAPYGNYWSELDNPGDYKIDLVDFEEDTNGNIKIFTEYTNPNNTLPSQNIPTGLATTNRGGTGVPNVISTNYTRTELPIAAGDEGLYLLPQNLNSTVTGSGASYTITGPYVEIEGLIFTNPNAWDDVADFISYAEAETTPADQEPYYSAAADAGNTPLKQGENGASAVSGYPCNNYNFTRTTMSKFACPITATLLPNKRYVLNIDLSYILTRATGGEYVFDAADIKL